MVVKSLPPSPAVVMTHDSDNISTLEEALYINCRPWPPPRQSIDLPNHESSYPGMHAWIHIRIFNFTKSTEGWAPGRTAARVFSPNAATHYSSTTKHQKSRSSRRSYCKYWMNLGVFTVELRVLQLVIAYCIRSVISSTSNLSRWFRSRGLVCLV